MIGAVLATIFPAIEKVIGNLFPDPVERQRVENEIKVKLLEQEQSLNKSLSDIIMSEAKGESWIQRSWRPITMLWMMALVSAYWLGLAQDIPIAIVEQLFLLVQIGIGGYIGGRTIEKVASNFTTSGGTENVLDHWKSGRNGTRS